MKSKENKVGIREFLFKKRGGDEAFKRESQQVIEELIHRIGRIKELEKKCMRLEKMVREGMRDRNRLATRIQKLEYKEKKK